MANIKQAIKNNPLQTIGLGFTIFVTVANVVVGYFLLTISSRLAPLQQDQAVLASELKANDEKDQEEHQTFVTKDTFGAVITRLDHISNRVDTIYSLVLRK